MNAHTSLIAANILPIPAHEGVKAGIAELCSSNAVVLDSLRDSDTYRKERCSVGKGNVAYIEEHKASDSASSDRKRLQPYFTADELDKLKEIRQFGPFDSDNDAIRSAVKAYAWFLKKREEGWTVQLAKNGKVKEVEFLQ